MKTFLSRALPSRVEAVSAWLRAGGGAFARAQGGASAVEFALIAPILVLGVLTMVDVGLALYQRMTIDHVLRAGAQAAMADQGSAQVLKIMQATAAKNFPAADGKPSAISFDPAPARYCACPEKADVSPSSAPSCSVTCAASASPYTYYRMGAKVTYKGMFIPPIALSSTIRVQIR